MTLSGCRQLFLPVPGDLTTVGATTPVRGQMVTDEQVRLLRSKRMDERTQESSGGSRGHECALGAQLGRTDLLPSETKTARTWRTRASVWGSDVLPLLERDEKGVLEAKTILEV